MKTITTRVMNFLPLLLILLFAPGLVFSQTDSNEITSFEAYTSLNSTAETLSTNECTANDFHVDGLRFVDVNGGDLGSCEPGTEQMVKIYVTFGSQGNAQRYSVFVRYDLWINGVDTEQTVERCYYENESIPIGIEVELTEFSWICGDRVELKNFYMAWQSNIGADCGPNGSKCYYDPDGYIVDAPLVTDFTYQQECGTNNVDFTADVTGGDINNPYTYSWTFGDGGTSNEANPTHTYATPGTYDVSLTATDSKGDFDDQTYTIEVNTVLTGLTLTPTHIECGGDTTGSIEASGVMGGSGNYTYSINPSPEGMVLTNNVFSNLPSGNYEITVTDEVNCSISQGTTINVNDSTAPTITAPEGFETEGCSASDVTSEGKTTLVYSSTAAEISAEQFMAEGGTYVEENVDSITYIDVASGTCDITITRTFTITDECGMSATADQTIIVSDNTAPSFTVPVDITIGCDQDSTDLLITGDVSDENDNCSVDIEATYSDVTAAGSCANASVITRTWTLTDDCGNSTTYDQTINIVDLDAPVAPTSPEDISYECMEDVPAAGNMTATDACQGDIIATGVDVVSDGEGCEKIINRSWTFVDACGNESSISQTITVKDTTPPSITTPAVDLAVECDGLGNTAALQTWLNTRGGAVASDNCSDVTWTNNFTALSDDCGMTGSATVEFTATDDCGNSSTTTATFTIKDDTAPIITEPARNLQVECNGNGNQDELQAWLDDHGGTRAEDACSELIWSYEFEESAENCGNTTFTKVIFTVADECGNERQSIGVFVINDNTPPTITAQAVGKTVECNENSLANLTQWLASHGGASAEDDCSDNITWSNDFEGLDEACGQTGSVTVIFTASDGCGNTATTSATYTITDTKAPVINNQPQNLTVECGIDDAPTMLQNWLNNNGGATAIDNCSEVIWTNNYGGANSDCSAPVEVTFTATDNCGNATSVTATYSVQDSIPPTLTGEASDISYECSSDIDSLIENWLDTNGGATATDDCSAIAWSNDFNGLSGGCGSTGSATVTFTATDGCGNEVSTTATISVNDTTAPEFTTEAENLIVECDGTGNTAEFDAWMANNGGAVAEDGCGNISWSTSVSASSDGCGNTTFVKIVFTAADECGNQSSSIATFTVVDTTAPEFVAPDNIILECGQDETDLNLTGSPTALADICDTQLTTSYTDAEEVGACAGERVITRTWVVSDDCGNESSDTQIITIQDTTAPEFTVPESVSIECNQDYTDLAITGDVTDESDNCSTNLDATYTDAVAEGDCPNSMAITRTWTLTDDCGNITEKVQSITVTDSTAPTFTVPESVTLECGDDYADLSLTGDVTDENDNCSTDLDANYTDSIAEGDCPNSVVVSRTWTLVDECGNTTSAVQTITIEDKTPPTFTVPVSLTFDCDADYNDLSITGDVTDEADNCSTNLDATYTDSVSQGDCPNNVVVSRTWSLTDECGNTTTAVQTITIEDKTGPTFTVPENITLECDQDYTDLSITGEATDINDNCSTGLEATYVDVIVPGDCPNTMSITRTWAVTDECGNTTEMGQTIMIQDETPPTFTVPESVTIDCGDDENDLSLTGDVTDEADNCSSDLEATYSDVSVEGTCPVINTITRTWTLIDECGNVTTAVQTISVQDNTGPEFEVPASVTIECTDDVNDLELTGAPSNITDNCSTDLQPTYSDVVINGDCPGSYVITRSWEVTDSCNNSTVKEQTITIQDSTAPVIDGDFEESISVNCSSIPGVDALVFTDNCSDNVEVVFNEVIGDESQNTYTITRTWTVSDECNNEALYTQVITVDNTPTTVNIQQQLCNDESTEAFDLSTLLGNDVPTDGTWTVVDGDITLNGSVVDPEGVAEGDYIINYEVDSPTGGCPTVYIFSLTVNQCIVLECNDPIISTAVTPNGDNVNDFFTITGIENCGFTIDLKIFNRWGAMIFDSNNYDNTWSGESSDASVGGANKVPTGTYYYIINLRNSGLPPFTGPIYIATK
ncbi:HYR-like domain-containing protein [Aegicerativicinus sediminis]|uniref:HYR-like domain-containing protein n=1 Tax=Aegicerativicinus sediminis TaxID=2893202 RepID=UPI00293BF4C4|nr:gliding motility-associated C-terminal domain-containing protein [Aegicerativicinus sediminis]